MTSVRVIVIIVWTCGDEMRCGEHILCVHPLPSFNSTVFQRTDHAVLIAEHLPATRENNNDDDHNNKTRSTAIRAVEKSSSYFSSPLAWASLSLCFVARELLNTGWSSSCTDSTT